MKTLWNLFEARVNASPAALAVCDRGQNYTYRDLAEGAEAFAQWLTSVGAERGDRVLLILPNSVQYISCYLGTLKAGCVVVALNPDLSSEELETIHEDARPSVVILDRKAERLKGVIARQNHRVDSPCIIAGLTDESSVQPVVGKHFQARLQAHARSDPSHGIRRAPRELRELAQIIYTSGTTGRPKGVMLSHGNLVSNCKSIVRYLSLTHRDSMLVVLPFFYSYGNSLLFTHLSVGARLVLASDFVFWNRALDLMQEQRVTGFAGVPSTFAMLLHRSDLARRRFPHLRYVTCAGGGLLPSHVAALRDALPGVEPFLMYGQTEATARLSTLLPHELDLKAGSIGRGIAGVTLRVLDDDGREVAPGSRGEIVARGPNLMMGYWNDPMGTDRVLRPEGLRTGDLAQVDEDGYIYIVGRKSDMIKTGAYRISPHEIEDIILRIPHIADVAVVGLPDEIWGEIPLAFAVPVSQDAVPQPEDVLEFCRRSLPRYKLPREIRFVDSLPRTASGKVRRAVLRELAATASES